MKLNYNLRMKASDMISRRRFLGASALLLGGTVLTPFAGHANKRSGITDTLKVALIGSGSRGTGAALNALRADENVELVAIADVFRDMVERSYDRSEERRVGKEVRCWWVKEQCRRRSVEEHQ